MDDHILIDTLHLDTMRVKRKRETDGTFLLYDVYYGQHPVSRVVPALE